MSDWSVACIDRCSFFVAWFRSGYNSSCSGLEPNAITYIKFRNSLIVELKHKATVVPSENYELTILWHIGYAYREVNRHLTLPLIVSDCPNTKVHGGLHHLMPWWHVKWNYFEIISVFYNFTCNHVWKWNKIISAAKGVLKLFRGQWTLENMHELQ